MSGTGVKTKIKAGGGAPPLASAQEGLRRTPPNGGNPRNAPGNWISQNFRLGDLCSFLNGGTPSKSIDAFFRGNIPWITGADITAPVVRTARSFITNEAIQQSATNKVPAGTVLLVTRTSVGKVALAGCELCFSQDITAITPNKQVLDSQYLIHFLRSKSEYFAQHSRGATIKGITREVINDLEIPLPPLPEQRRIAEVLDRAEEVRRRRRHAISLCAGFSRSLFVDMFGISQQNSMDWPRKKLGDLLSTEPQNGLYKPSSEYGSGTPILRIDAFYDGAVTKISDLKRVRLTAKEINLYQLRADDIVINRVNSMEYLGKSAVIPRLPEPTVFESNMMRFSMDRSKIHPRFLIHFLQSEFIKAQITNAAKHAVNQSSINQTDVKGFMIAVPPMPLQEKFVSRIQHSEKLRSIHLSSLVQLDSFFISLQHRAFRGEL